MSTLNENYQASIQLTQQSGTLITLSTANKYVPSNIQLTLSAQSGALTVAGGGLSAGNGSASLNANSGFYNGTSYTSTDKITLATTEASGYYKLIASGSGTVNRAAITKRVTTAGWLAADGSAVTVPELGATSLSSDTKDESYYIKKSTTKVGSNTATYGNATVTPGASSQTVTLSDGYYPSNRTVTINAISETSAVGTIKSGSATISSVAIGDYNSTNGNFPITGSAEVSQATVEVAGYVSSTKGTKQTNTASLDATIGKIVGSIGFTMNSGNASRSPSISKQSVPSGVTDAATSDSATTTVPSTGVWVAVKSGSNTGTLTATPAVTTAGYGTSANHGIEANTITVGASESSTTYVKIKSATVSSPNTTASIGNPVFQTSGDYANQFKLTASGTIAKPTVSAEGYIKSSGTTDVIGTRNTGTISGNKYLTRVTVGSTAPDSKTVTQSLSKGSVGSGEGWTNAASSGSTVTSAPSSGVYVKVTAAAISDSISSTGKVTVAGYGTPTSGQYIEATATSTSITASAANIFVPIQLAGTPSINVTNLSGSDAVTVGTLASDYYPINAINVTATATMNVSSAGWYAGGDSKSNKHTTRRTVGKMIAAQFTNSGGTVTCTRAGYVPQGALPQNGTISDASFAKTGTSGVTYTDYSDSAPVLDSEGYLYVNAGYVSNIKISLAKLVPDNATKPNGMEYSDGLRANFALYDESGVLVSGTIQDYNREYTVSTS